MSQVDTPDISPGPSRWIGAVSGFAGVAIFLALGELFDGLSPSVPSPVVAVGDFGIDTADARTTKIVIEWFGSNDKLALVIGIVVISLFLGAIVGLLGRKRRWVPPVVFAVFGIAGGLAIGRDPLANDALGWLAALGAALGGWLTYELLRRRATSSEPSAAVQTSASSKQHDEPQLAPGTPAEPRFARDDFMQWVVGATALAVFAALGGRWLRGRESVSAARAEIAARFPPVATVAEPTPTLTTAEGPLEGLSPYITSNEDFYRIDTAIVVPQVDPDDWRLQIVGMVDEPYELTLDEIINSPDLVDETVTISCVSNEIGGKLVGNAVWTGIPLRPVLERAGIQPEADQVVGVSVDGWTAGFPIDVLNPDRTALIAVAMNGEPLPISHGFPARLVVAGLYGYVSATKWLAGIGLTRWDDFDGYWIPRGWSKEGPIKITSRIDTPRGGSRRSPGEVGIGGVAWAPTRGIGAVEVQVDDGAWLPAELGETVSDETWVQWTFRRDFDLGRHSVRVRAYDLAGEVQPPGPKPSRPDGAEGYHTIALDIET